MEPEKKNLRKSLLRAVCLLAALAGGVQLLVSLGLMLVSRYWGGAPVSFTDAASLGIIGGADGPTAVFVTWSPPEPCEALLGAVLLAAGIWGLRRLCLQGREKK